MWSITLLSEQDYGRILSKDVDDLRPDQQALREYLIAEVCRRRPISKYMDGKEVDCAELNGERCDVCWRVHKHTEAGKRKRDEEERERRVRHRSTSYSIRRDMLTIFESERGARWIELLDALKDLGGKCGVCWVMEGMWDADHPFSDCDLLNSLMERPYDEIRSGIRYDGDACCFSCSRPCDMCGNYLKGKRSEEEDVIIPAVLTAFMCRYMSMMEMIREKAERGFSGLDLYIAWLGKRCTIGDVNCTNAFLIFLGIIEVKAKLIDIDKEE